MLEHIWQVTGGRSGKRADTFMKSLGEEKKQKKPHKKPKQKNETKPKSEEKRVSYNTVSKK